MVYPRFNQGCRFTLGEPVFVTYLVPFIKLPTRSKYLIVIITDIIKNNN